MNDCLAKLEEELEAADEASILDKAQALSRSLETLLQVLTDFETRIAATEKRIDEQKST